MLNMENIIALRMERQFLYPKAGTSEYDALYLDMQPGQNVYWNGFGDPPSITFRADFDDIEYNRRRQKNRTLIKGRFQGGNIGWIMPQSLELYAGLYIKPLQKATEVQLTLLELIEREGPMNIQLMKETTGILVKYITPALHRLQEAFLVYEDQYDGDWDRAWYRFGEMFPDANLTKYTRHQALMIVLQRFAYRHILFDVSMAKSFYRLPEKQIKTAVLELLEQGILVEYDGSYLLKADREILQSQQFFIHKSVFVLHRNDFLVKSNEHWLKEKYKDGQNDILQYILMDGEFCGAVMGHFKNGPYIIENVVTHVNNRKQEIIAAVYAVNSSVYSPIKRYKGELL